LKGQAFLGGDVSEANQGIQEPGMKSEISPMWLTYFMVNWTDIEQHDSDQKCTECGRPLRRTEYVTDSKGLSYEGFVCHADKRVTWLRVG
jgi:hypothetical protein